MDSGIMNIIKYNPDTGIFTYKTNRRVVKTGDIAGCINDKGYRKIGYKGKAYSAHRLAFLFMGEKIPNQVDHIDGNRDNNKWNNLRSATAEENSKNVKLRKTSRTGIIGVNIYSNGKYIAQIGHNGKKYNLGYYNNIDDAIKARKEAEVKFGFHKNHGRIINDV